MVPKQPKGGRATGTSFNGAFLYYTHDKREEGEDIRLTADRVDWMEFRNLATDDPHIASSIMAATAKSQDDLKRQAGASLAGYKSDQAVYHYSLGWSPSEKDGLTKAEMMRAANESIRALGADANQAALIAHNDTAHPHVHVIINRVNPENGKMLDLWNSQKNLSKWAMAYEQERGEIHCDKRVENWKRREKGEKIYAEKDLSYQHHEAAKDIPANDNDKRKVQATQKAKDAALAASGKKLHSRHGDEWKALSANYKAQKEAVYRSYKDQIKGTDKEIKEQFRPAWAELYKQQWAETKKFEEREKRIMGKLENTFAAIKAAKKIGEAESRGGMAGAFNFMISAKARSAALDKLHASQKRELSTAQKHQTDAAIKSFQSSRTAELKDGRRVFASDRQGLIDKQAAQKSDLKRKWSKRHSERKIALNVLSRQAGYKKAGTSAPNRSGEAKQGSKVDARTEARKAFEKAVRGKRTRKSRSRSRKL